MIMVHGTTGAVMIGAVTEAVHMKPILASKNMNVCGDDGRLPSSPSTFIFFAANIGFMFTDSVNWKR